MYILNEFIDCHTSTYFYIRRILYIISSAIISVCLYMYLDCIFAAAIRLPEEPLAARLAGPAEDLNLVGDHKC